MRVRATADEDRVYAQTPRTARAGGLRGGVPDLLRRARRDRGPRGPRAGQRRVDRSTSSAVLGIAWEGACRAPWPGRRLLQDLANAIYIYGHWPVLIVAGFLLYRYRREHYYTLRNACLLTGLLGLFVFALFPVAPPRLTDLPLIDTVTQGRLRLPADPAAGAREPVRGDAELPRGLEPRRRDRRLPRDRPLGAAAVRDR